MSRQLINVQPGVSVLCTAALSLLAASAQARELFVDQKLKEIELAVSGGAVPALVGITGVIEW